MLTPSTCSGSPAPRSQDCEKLGEGLGTRRRIRMGAQVSCVIKPERFSTQA